VAHQHQLSGGREKEREGVRRREKAREGERRREERKTVIETILW
jgi:hypothetical protein